MSVISVVLSFFSSALFTGAMSDKELLKQCDILPPQIDSSYLQRSNSIMADKGFLIKEEMQKLGMKLNLPPFSRSRRQMPAGDVLLTKHLAKHRVHEERAIAKIKKIVSGKMS